MQAPFIPVLFMLGFLLAASFLAYKYWNIDPIHVWTRSYPDYSLSEDLTNMSDPQGKSWIISYEGIPQSTFSGIVRHISPDEESLVPMLSYDILVASGDFADPGRVRTTTVNHMFAWHTLGDFDPSGQINLLHTVAKDRLTFEELREIQNGETVRISGVEIYKIDAYNSAGGYLGYWMDKGCNTILVTDVEIQPKR